MLIYVLKDTEIKCITSKRRYKATATLSAYKKISNNGLLCLQGFFKLHKYQWLSVIYMFWGSQFCLLPTMPTLSLLLQLLLDT